MIISEVTNPKVSVLVLCFRHAAFLSQCLDSIFSQVTDFNYEVIIGDDASDDGSQDIIRQYISKYPEKISQVFLHEKNWGDFGRTNALIIQKAAKAPYAIIIEGDDYWIAPNKLALQVEVLDANPDSVICFHNALIQYEDEPRQFDYVNHNQKEISTLDDLIGEDEIWFMATASVMFRNIYINEAPDWYFKSKSGDIPMYILLAEKGNIRYIDKVMSVYRKHFQGMSFSDGKQDAFFLLNRIEMYQNINKYLKFKYHQKISKNIARYYLMMANSVQYGNNFFISRFYVLKSLFLSKPNTSEHIKKIVQSYIIPSSIMNVYANVKWQIEKKIIK
jgi:glycosyltransferase involved in cell wall biosynthesis